MKYITIENTRRTPKVEFTRNGELTIEGKSFCEDPRSFYVPLIEWVSELDTNTVSMDIKLDYMNTSSTKMMNEFIKHFDANTKITHKIINWYYEEEDEDMLEAGQIFEENVLTTQFVYREMVVV